MKGESAYETMRRLVIELLERQGYSAQHLRDGVVQSEDAARAEAASLIADDGPLGAEAVSERIVDFAIAACGGDKTKLQVIRGAIEEGFRQVKGMLGVLP